MTGGTLRFGEIEQVPKGWWPDRAESVWTVWSRDTYYLWGANAGNIDTVEGRSLRGAGMAGPTGPTWGLGHPNYVGIDTMALGSTGASGTTTTSQFARLHAWLAGGNNVVVPTFHGKYSLGTGIAGGMDPDVWRRIQLTVMQGIVGLAAVAGAVVIPAGTYWPDCRTSVDLNGLAVGICSNEYRHHLSSATTGTHLLTDGTSLRAVVTLLSSPS